MFSGNTLINMEIHSYIINCYYLFYLLNLYKLKPSGIHLCCFLITVTLAVEYHLGDGSSWE